MFFSANIGARTGGGVGVVFILFGLPLFALVLLSLLLAFFLPKVFKQIKQGSLKRFAVRAILIFVLLPAPFLTYYFFDLYIYNRHYIKTDTLEQISRPIAKAFSSFCKDNDRFPRGEDEVNNILAPLGFNRKVREYTNQDLELEITSAFNRNNRSYDVALRTEGGVGASYILSFNQECVLIGEKSSEGPRKALFN